MVEATAIQFRESAVQPDNTERLRHSGAAVAFRDRLMTPRAHARFHISAFQTLGVYSRKEGRHARQEYSRDHAPSSIHGNTPVPEQIIRFQRYTSARIARGWNCDRKT